MIYRIADFDIDIICHYENNDIFLEEYLEKEQGTADFTIEISEEDIDHEIKNAIDVQKKLRFSRGYLERLAILRKIVEKMLMHDVFLIHGVALEHEGKGYLFTAKSGVGKTTHAELWQKYFGKENVRILNGDKPLIKVEDGRFFAYGTPWCGKEGYSINARCEIKAVCFIVRSEDNSITKIGEEEGLTRLMSQVMVVDSADFTKQFDLLCSMVEKLPMYKLMCNKTTDAARVAYEGMKE